MDDLVLFLLLGLGGAMVIEVYFQLAHFVN